MRLPRLTQSWGVLLLSAAMPGLLLGQPPKDPEADRILDLIAQLGDAKFAKRETASRELVDFGEKALPALKRVAAAHADFEVQTRARQAVRAIMLGARKSKSIGLETVLIDVGEFQMGSKKTEPGRRADESEHGVRITKPFLLGAYEVTQDEYQKVMKANPSWFAATGGGKDKVAGQDTSRFPVERVTWFDAVVFCNRLSKQDGYEPFYKLIDAKREDDAFKSAIVKIEGGNGYRLPTEAEWEFACRAKTETLFHFGNESTGLEGNVKAIPATGYGAPPRRPDIGRTTKVGSYKPNDWGLYDMHGNAGEWCQDWYDKDFYGKSPKDDPPGPETGTHRLHRGGSWLISYGSCRSASRLFHTPDEKNYYTGFRVARTP